MNPRSRRPEVTLDMVVIALVVFAFVLADVRRQVVRRRRAGEALERERRTQDTRADRLLDGARVMASHTRVLADALHQNEMDLQELIATDLASAGEDDFDPESRAPSEDQP